MPTKVCSILRKNLKMETNTFTRNEDQNQFELSAGGHTAFLEYYTEVKKIYLTHTEAPEAMRGKGAAGELVKGALQYAKDNGLTVVPSCSYVAHYIDKHPEWASVLSEGYQM